MIVFFEQSDSLIGLFFDVFQFLFCHDVLI
nr:hypothetical protein WCOTENJF_WCOTENJF_CDS_0020 [uncultured phage]